MEIKVIKEKENMYILDDGRVRCFLFLGETEALLVDAGFWDVDIAGKVKEITSLPVRVILTHGDGDHTGSLKAFGACLMHEEDAGLVPDEIAKTFVKDGDVISVGDFEFEILHTPGHTYGSISLLEKKQRFILTGDGVQKNGMIFMFGEKRNFPLYLESLKKLGSKTDSFDAIYPSHSIFPIESSAIEHCLQDATDLYEGRITECKKHPQMPCNIYQGSYTGFLYSTE